MVSKAARAQWGLNSEIIRTIYQAVVEPTVLYAAGAWGNISEKVYAKQKLDRITRSFAIRIAKAHRTVSLVAAVTLSRILPLDLRATEQYSLYLIKRSGETTELPGRTIQKRINPAQLPHPAERERLPYRHIETENDITGIENSYPRIYTDGSKLDGRVGGALTIQIGNEEQGKASFKLEKYNSVFQAEMFAIVRALEITSNSPKYSSANILSDARSALECITDPNSLHPLAHRARTLITSIKQQGGTIELYWVRSHIGIKGNERADELAKHAALNNKQQPPYDVFPLSFAKHLIRQKTLEQWQQRYSTSTTGTTTKQFLPDIRRAYKILSGLRMTNLRAQLLTGHGGFKSYLFRFKLINTFQCICDSSTEETIMHILTECPRFAAPRFDCESQIDVQIQSDNLVNIFDDDNCRMPFLEYAERVARQAARANGSTVM